LDLVFRRHHPKTLASELLGRHGHKVFSYRFVALVHAVSPRAMCCDRRAEDERRREFRVWRIKRPPPEQGAWVVQRQTLISQIALPELAPCADRAGCRASSGRFPPPLMIRQLYSVVDQESTERRARMSRSESSVHHCASHSVLRLETER
jgi:hypothetical protein